MILIGLTGPSGAGKGTVADIFASYGLPVLDADKIYHELLLPPSPCLDAIAERFGSHVLSSDGTLDRRALGDTVFSDREALNDLNHIAHRFVMLEVNKRVDQLRLSGVRAAILDAPQLFEAEAEKICSSVVSVLADRELRVARIMKRDGIDEAHALKRINAQKSDAFFKEHSDYVIENNADPSELQIPIRKILHDLEVLAT